LFSLSIPLLMAARPAVAHFPAHAASGINEGLLHALMGLDHVLAAFAVGLWAVQRGGKYGWILPGAFILFMGAGWGLGLVGLDLLQRESGTAASVLVLGLLVMAAARPPLGLSLGLIGLFALLHGHSHAIQSAEVASGLAYGTGMVIMTGLLHLAGISVFRLLRRERVRRFVRLTGGSIAAAGCIMAFGWI